MCDARVIDGIRYELLSEPTLAGAIDCVSQVFPSHEPLAHHLGITEGEFRQFAGMFYPNLVADGLSWVALDEKSGRVVGVRISEDYEVSRTPSFDTLNPKFKPIFSLLSDLGSGFQKNQSDLNARYVHMFMVAVRDEFLERGIAPTMNRCFFRNVHQRGYTHAVTEPTGSISQHILRDKFGFKVLHQIPYRQWTYKGNPVFSGLREHSHAMLMEREITELAIA